MAGMVKETKYLRRQAEKAERMARAISENYSNLTKTYPRQAEVLKGAKKSDKKQR
jgi:hypothetical protein